MKANFRVKYWFEGILYSSGVDDVHRDATLYHIFLPTELRCPPPLSQAKPQFVTVLHIGDQYKLQSNTALSIAMFKSFLIYVHDHRPSLISC